MSSEACSQFDEQIEKWVQQRMKGNHSLSDIAQEKVQEMEALAHFLYRNEEYQDASHFFRLLAFARPSISKYWKGLGACLQMLQEYDEAINCYASSHILNQEETDPYLYVHAADCYFALKQKEEGLKALEAACLSAEKTKDPRISRHVTLMRELWSR
jgi:secretion system chaperone SscA